jgi:hypothetical protein
MSMELHPMQVRNLCRYQLAHVVRLSGDARASGAPLIQQENGGGSISSYLRSSARPT